jgi:HAD superfamily hydrolase (TIGR01484 family)
MFDRTVYKLAAFDLDGTILDDGEMSVATHKMLIALHSFGLHIAIATGRHLHSIPSDIIDLPFIRYVIAANGAHVVDLADKGTISYSPIDKDKTSQLACFLKQKVKEIDIFLKEELVISVESSEELKRVFSKGGNETKLLPDYLKSAQVITSPCLYVLEKNSEVEKFYCNFSSKAECGILLAEIKREFDVEAITTTGSDIEITARGINKGYGINVLSKHLGVNLE